LRRAQANLKRYPRRRSSKPPAKATSSPPEAELAKTGKRKSTFENRRASFARISPTPQELESRGHISRARRPGIKVFPTFRQAGRGPTIEPSFRGRPSASPRPGGRPKVTHLIRRQAKQSLSVHHQPLPTLGITSLGSGTQPLCPAADLALTNSGATLGVPKITLSRLYNDGDGCRSH